jgi:tetratricopeptide (TPR) repeat protein
LRNALVPLGPHPRLLDVLQNAHRLADELADEKRLAQILSFLSNYHGNVGHSDLALETGERSLVLGERVGAVNLLIVGNLSVGETYRTLGNYPKAREFLTRAIDLIEPGNQYDVLGQAGLPSVRARSHLAWTSAEMGDFSAAQKRAAEALQLANESAHAYSMCHACLGLGGTRLRQGEFEAAIPILARGLTISEQVPLLRPPIGADLGVAHARCGRIAEGHAHVEHAVERATAMGRFSRLPLLLVKCGEVHLLAGEQDEAIRLATSALGLATEQKERGNEVYALHLLAEIYTEMSGEATAAERYYREAFTLATELGMRPLAAHSHAGLSQLYGQLGKPQKAREHHLAATAMYREMDMRFWLVQLEAESMDLA